MLRSISLSQESHDIKNFAPSTDPKDWVQISFNRDARSHSHIPRPTMNF